MELRYEARPDHLLVHGSGEFDYAQARAAVSRVIQACAQHNVTKILVDGRGITSLVSIADRFELATQLSTESKGTLRMAVVMSSANMFTKTFEDTAANRGAPLRTTDSMREAREFLGLPPE